MTNEEVVAFIRMRIAAKMEPQLICEELMTRCLAPDCQMGGLGCDNMTVVLIALLHGKTYEDLADKCALHYSHKANNRSLLSQSSSSTTSSISSDDDDINANMESMEKSTNGDHENGSNDSSKGNEVYSKLSASANDKSLTVA
ncbi:unnamed protein product [Medioppia subpectinata]|uniref:Uncharacterized protein n=1 Tax=Medioppia subpectinata TaxID=1979941 RepID=A0A7R9L5R9_9ACAR|nr:unnamed protein product [Medioppia subpectinata]CAG2115772.1 unnamed protein product [Medioppia subpectinata]